MAPQLGASLDGGGGEGWQSNPLGSLNEIYVKWLACTSCLDWVAQHTAFQDWDKFFGLL